MTVSVRTRVSELREDSAPDEVKDNVSKRKSILERYKDAEGRFTKATHGGQLPDIIAVSGVPYLDLSHILYGDFPKVEDNKLVAGVFGQVSMYPTQHDVDTWVRDYEQFAYMLNTLSKNGKVPPFILFLGEDNASSRKAMGKRKEKFIDSLRSSGRVYDDQTERIFASFGDVVVKIPLVLAVFNKEKKRFYVIDKHNNKLPLADWLEGTETPNDVLKADLVERIRAFESGGKFKDVSSTLSIACCDARSFGFGDEMRLKTLGALLSKDRLDVLLRHKFPSGNLIYELHTGCGYITAAIQFYELLKELQEKAETREDLYFKIKRALSGQQEGHLTLGEEHARNLDKQKKELFRQVFASSNADFQKILFHMINHLSLFVVDDSNKRITMPAYDRVVNVMKKKGLAYDPRIKAYLITEELLAEQVNTLALVSGRIKTRVDLTIFPTILSFADYARYNLPLTEENGLLTIQSTDERVDDEENRISRINEFGEMKLLPDILGL